MEWNACLIRSNFLSQGSFLSRSKQALSRLSVATASKKALNSNTKSYVFQAKTPEPNSDGKEGKETENKVWLQKIMLSEKV